MPSPVPVEFGKYQLLERLAVGGMAELYRARFQAMAGVSKPVVIKKILPAFADSDAFVRMFVNEARIAVSLSHGNIAQVFDFGEVDGEYFLAMEYVHGQPLSRVLRRAHALQFPYLPEAIALQIGMGMCRGLHYAHSRVDDRGRSLQIVHRDVSPQNVLLGYAGEVKIVDFGIARARNATDAMMQASGVKGKFPYFSPEQARGEPVDFHTDLYATGVVLYQMLCGRLPHLGKMVPAMQSIIRGEFPAPRTLNPRLSAGLEATLIKAMAYAPADRFASAQDMEHALADALHALGPRPPPIGDFMSFLFEPELLAEGQEVKLPRGLLEQVPEWRKGPQHSEPPGGRSLGDDGGGAAGPGGPRSPLAAAGAARRGAAARHHPRGGARPRAHLRAGAALGAHRRERGGGRKPRSRAPRRCASPTSPPVSPTRSGSGCRGGPSGPGTSAGARGRR